MSDEAPDPPVKTGLQLAKVPAQSRGRELGLLAGDVLVYVNGGVFIGNLDALAKRFAGAGTIPLALTFQRGAARFTVLARSTGIAQWEGADNPATTDELSRDHHPDFLQNWVLLRSEKGVYDLYPEKLGVLAMACPPLWLMQYRLWGPFAAVVAAIMASALVAWWAIAPVWIAASLHVQRSAGLYLRADRAQLAIQHCLTFAARNEKQAHETVRKLYPDSHYIYAPKPKPVTPTA